MNPITGLAVGRILIGLVTFVSPTLAARLFLLDAPGNPQLDYMGRMFASREIAVGAATLAAPAQLRTPLVAAGVAIDLADAGAGALAGRSGSIGKVPTAFLTGVALAAAGTGVAALVSRRG
jgi:hypothetical protein